MPKPNLGDLDRRVIEPIARQEAKARGLKRYFTGKPCKKGHLAERKVGNCACVVCAKIAYERWRHDNPDKAKAATDKWRADHFDEYTAQNRARANAWHWLNQERANAASREYSRTHRAGDHARGQKFRDSHPGYRATEIAAWAKAHPEDGRAKSAHRRAQSKNPSWVDQAEIKAIFRACPDGMTVDHIVPYGGRKKIALTADGYPICGLNVPWNLTYVTKTHNDRKQHRMSRGDQEFCETQFNVRQPPQDQGSGQ